MKKLYDDNAYATTFDAVITAVERDADESSVWLTLDATLFFPEEGGQSPDRGTINGLAVTDVQIKDGVIRHKVSCGGGKADGMEASGVTASGMTAAGLTVGATVHGVIDWEYRYRNMQMHTGEHIFSGLVHSIFGYDNVGFHLSDRTATMDYNGKITEEQLRELEERANRVITENREVNAWYATEEQLARMSYRSKKAIEGAVRLVEIDGVDLCACCAPHVKTTGEVGCFKLIGWENYKGGVRVSYRCGFRAMEDYGERLALLTKLSQILSVKTEDLCATVEKLQEERKRLAYELVAKDRAIVRTRIAELAAADGRAKTADGRIDAACVLFLEPAEASIIRYAVDEMKVRYAGVCCALLPVGETKGSDPAAAEKQNDALITLRYLIEQDGGDVSAWQQMLRERFGAKGGGPKNSVQGSVTAEEQALREALAAMAD